MPTLGTVDCICKYSVSTIHMEVAWGGDNNYVITYMSPLLAAVAWDRRQHAGFNFTNAGSVLSVYQRKLYQTLGQQADVDMLGGINSQQTSLVIRSNYYRSRQWRLLGYNRHGYFCRASCKCHHS